MLRHLLPCLLCAGLALPVPTTLAAEEEAAPAQGPLVTISIPDLTRTRERFTSTPYGRAWNDERVKPLRDLLGQQAAMLAMQLGINPLSILQQAEGFEAVLQTNPAPGKDATILAQLRGERIVEPVFAALQREQFPVWQAGAEAGVLKEADRLLFGFHASALGHLPEGDGHGDLNLRFSRQGLLTLMHEAASNPDERRAVQAMEEFLPSADLSISLTEAGIRQDLRLAELPIGLHPIDQAVLDKLPSDCMAVSAVGVDGKSWWAAHKTTLLRLVAEGMGAESPEQVELQLNAVLGSWGVAKGVNGLIEDFQGTVVAAMSQGGGWIPGITLALPRSESLDQLVQFGCLAGGLTMPEDNAFTFLILRGLGDKGGDLAPASVAFGRDATHWWIATDSVALDALLAGKGGWLDGPLAKELLNKAGKDPSFLAVTRSSEVIRALVPLAGIGANALEQKPIMEAVLYLAHEFAKQAGDDFVFGRGDENGGYLLRTEGPLGGLTSGLGGGQLPVVAIIAAIAIPNLMESRVTANEAAASIMLKSGIFPAQIQFAAGGYLDADKDNRGEYAFPAWLSGQEEIPGLPDIDLTLLGEEFGNPDVAVTGYHYIMYLPDGKGGAVSLADYKKLDDDAKKAMANDAEKYFICYAWPEVHNDTGRRTFVMTQDGRVYTKAPPIQEQAGPPAWNDALKNKTYEPGKAGQAFREMADNWGPLAR